MNDISSSDSSSYAYIVEQNVGITLAGVDLPVRINVYRPKTDSRVPVLVTFGPYGKDTPYAVSVNMSSPTRMFSDVTNGYIVLTHYRLLKQPEAKVRALCVGNPRSSILD
jgi:predicted acyl esterase